MTERRPKIERENPESRAIQAIKGIYQSPDVQAAAQAHLDSIQTASSLIFPNGEISVTHPTATYKLGLGSESVEASFRYNGYDIKERVEIRDGKAAHQVLVKDDKGEYLPQDEETDPKKITSEVLDFAAAFHADSDYIRDLIPRGLIKGAVVERINYSPGLGIVVNRMPTDLEKSEVSKSIQGTEIEYLILPVAGELPPRWTYQEGRAVQALISYRSTAMGLRIPTGLSSREDGGFVVGYHSDSPLAPDLQVELFDGLDIRGLNFAGKELRAEAH
ncbi:hypothetical protein E6Q11_00585 [Candidatus Dojkabacteria bacterium]|uniref:Uncharacterized protein n=1 Tax=Candidatus Dojkabacteria bacterium TaxID=2099670 RepID=A0A5C7JDL9_9BACT|nr:MAG: hypothetical protein E6Q11_00585 [Candidatus Dojkabacteria bacterium]